MNFLSQIFSYNNNKSFYKNVLTAFTGTFIAQVIPIILSPVLARIYAPEHFGLFTTFFSVVSILSVIVTLRLELALPLPKELVEVKIIVIHIMYVVTLMSFLFFLISLCLPNKVSQNFFGGYKIVLCLIPISVFLNGINQTLVNLNGRINKFNISSIGRVIQALFANVFPILIALLLTTLNKCMNMIYAFVIGQLSCMLYYLYKSNLQFKECSFKKIKQTLKTFQHFPLYNAPSAFLDQLSASLSIFFFTLTFGKIQTGYYALTTRILVIPSAIIAIAVSQVFFQTAIQKINSKQLVLPFLKQNTKVLAIVGIVPFLILFLFAPGLFSFVFGSEWEISGRYAQILAITSFIKFIISPLSLMLAATSAIKQLSLWQVCFFIENLILVLLAYYFKWTTEFYLILLAIADTLIYIFYYYLIYSAAKKTDAQLLTAM